MPKSTHQSTNLILTEPLEVLPMTFQNTFWETLIVNSCTSLPPHLQGLSLRCACPAQARTGELQLWSTGVLNGTRRGAHTALR